RERGVAGDFSHCDGAAGRVGRDASDRIINRDLSTGRRQRVQYRAAGDFQIVIDRNAATLGSRIDRADINPIGPTGATGPGRYLNLDLTEVFIAPRAFDGVHPDAAFVPACHANVTARVVDGDHAARRQVVSLVQFARLPGRLRGRLRCDARRGAVK